MAVTEFDTWLDRFANGAGPGAAVAVQLQGERVYAAARGLANLEWQAPIDLDTVFRIGSVTKQFTAAAIVRLAEAGKLRLDDAVVRLLPNFGPAGERITVRQLLNHSSGIGDYTQDPHFMTAEARKDHTPLELVAIIRELPHVFEPGARSIYNNSNYVLLGAIVEAATGRAYDAFLKQTFFEPLGLANTHYLHDAEIIPKRASGYTSDGAGNAEPLAMTNPHGAGGLGSTVGDLLAWSQALREGRVVSRAGYQAMTLPAPVPDGEVAVRGFGLMRHELRGDVVIAHSGRINGFVAHLAHWPAHDLTVAALANANPFPVEQLAYGLARRALGQADAAHAPEAVSPETLAACAACYAFATTEVLDLAVASGGLASSLPQPGSLYRPCGDQRFFLEGDPEITFRFTDVGRRSVVFQDYRSPMLGRRIVPHG